MLRKFKCLEELHVDYATPSQPALAELASFGSMDQLTVLSLGYSRFTSSCLVYLKTFPNLRELRLGECDIGDESVAQLCSVCPNLEVFALCSDRLTDTGVKHAVCGMRCDMSRG